MREQRDRIALINAILENDANQITEEEEEVIHMLLERKVSRNTSKMGEERLTFGERMADRIARFAGSWTFILTFVAVLAAWIVFNIVMLSGAFDPYPFILLNLILSCVAALQAPVIMMSQNRQEEKDRLRALNDYKTNLKSEIIVEDLHRKIDRLLEGQQEMVIRLEAVEAAVPGPENPS
ncbi:MAG: DUF1003 domain-containing protein [Clostridiales bacterium]|nr:DUF1003 domain-containing protein [Clostridiales bacterium]